MKVGILTFHYAYNYGAALQVYGLQETLAAMGFDATVLDYRAPSITSHNRPLGIRSGRFMYVLPMRWRFDQFRRKQLRLTPSLTNFSDVAQEAKKYDAIIVGSDQVWNTHLVDGVNLAYFLGIDGCFKRISYAACFGEREQREGSYSQIAKLLLGFDHLSVRDDTSCGLVKDLTGRTASLVLDPTLLYDYTNLKKEAITCSTPYILVYSLWPKAEQETLSRLTERVRTKLGYPIVSISQMRDFKSADKHIRTAGPREWNQAFREAAFICTDSFHGVMFSIKYKKPFVAVAHNQRSFRISEFLEKYGLGKRLIEQHGETGDPDLSLEAIDYERVYEILEKDIQHSRNFLYKSLTEKRFHE